MKRSALILFNSAERLGLNPRWVGPYGLLQIQVENKYHPVFFGISPLNSELACYLARNKHATHVTLEQAGLPSIPYLLPENYQQLRKFYDKHQPIILKPTLGARSVGVRLITGLTRLRTSSFKNRIAEKYIDGTETRYIVLNQKVVAVQQRKPIGKINTPEQSIRTNIEKNIWDEDLCKLAINATKALGLNYAAVDTITDGDKKSYVLEVNTSPGLYFFENPHHGKPVKLSEIYLNAVAQHLKSTGKKD